MKICDKCGAEKPTWSTRKLCPRCLRGEKLWNKEITKAVAVAKGEILNTLGEPVKVRRSSKVIVFRKRSKRTCVAYCYQWSKGTGELTGFREVIHFNVNFWKRSIFNDPEQVACIISAESIHLAFYSLGLGRENKQLDKAGYHTWLTEEARAKDYEGINLSSRKGAKSI